MKRTDSRRGMVLVTVLWSIALLSALAMAASVTFRGYAGVMALERDRLQAEALLTAGLETAAGVMDTSRDSPLAGFETTISLGTGAVRVHLDYEGGRIDVGKAPAELLASMLRSIGASEATAGNIAKRIVERRNPVQPSDSGNPTSPADVAPRVSGSEQPFADIAQLLTIPGMTPEWVAAATPLTTVFGDQTVDPMTAPPGVIAVLPGIDGQQAAAFVNARRSSPRDVDRLVRMLASAQKYLAVKPQRVASVDLTAAMESGYGTTAHAVIVVLPQDSQPYRVLVWTHVPYAKASIDVPPMAQR